MKRIKPCLLMLPLLFTASCGYTEDAKQQTSMPLIQAQLDFKNTSTKDLINMVKTPTTPVELIQNIKFALDNELLLREDFFTEENLKQFTGGTEFEWGPTGDTFPNFINLTISNFTLISRFKPYDQNSPNYLYITLRGKKDQEGKLSVSINPRFEFGDTRLTYTDLKQLFSDKWHILEQEPWGSNQEYREPTTEHGNEEWGYTIQKPNSVEEQAFFAFGPSEVAERIQIGLEQK